MLCVLAVGAGTPARGDSGTTTTPAAEAAASQAWPFTPAQARQRQARADKQLGLPQEIMLDCGKGAKLQLVLIPGGRFEMGSPKDEKDRQPDEGPQRVVTISQPFYMGTCEVTQAQYQAVLGKEPWKDKVWTKADPNHPASNITWEMAAEFCEALTKQTGRPVRLPTEAQWEYACRAGSETRFCYGDDPDEAKLGDYAWVSGNVKSPYYSRPVGRKKANAFGLHDMHGNVFEWCSDWYQDTYKGLAGTDPTGPAKGKLRVLRGGCWNYKSKLMRSASRFKDSPGSAIVTYGFRVVVPIKQPGSDGQALTEAQCVRMAKLVRLLDDRSYTQRQQAMAELRKLVKAHPGKLCLEELRRLAKKAESQETRSRVEDLIEELSPPEQVTELMVTVGRFSQVFISVSEDGRKVLGKELMDDGSRKLIWEASVALPPVRSISLDANGKVVTAPGKEVYDPATGRRLTSAATQPARSN